MTESRHLRIKSESWQEDLKTILEASPVGMVVFDDGEMVIYANPQAEALFGTRLTRPGPCPLRPARCRSLATPLGLPICSTRSTCGGVNPTLQGMLSVCSCSFAAFSIS